MRDPIRHLLLLLVPAAAWALRLYRLDTQSLWYDEAVTARVAGQGLAELTRWTAGDIQPPLYYYLEAATTALLGRSEWALRALSAAVGLLAVAVMIALARRLFGRRAAVAGGLLVSVSPLYVYYSQEARMYSLLVLLGTVLVYAVLRATAGPAEGAAGGASAIANRRAAYPWWVAAVLLALAALYTHYFAAFLLAALAVWLLAMPARRRWWRWGLASGAAVLVGYSPWLPFLLGRLRDDRSYWTGPLKLDEALRHLVLNVTAAAPETMLEAEAWRWLPLAILAVLVSLVGLWRSPRGRQSLPLLAAWLLIPIVGVLLLAGRNPKFNPRYLMLVSPAYTLLLAGGFGGWMRGRQPRGAALLGGAVLAFALLPAARGLDNWFTDPAFTKAQWREAAAFVQARIAPEEAVLLVSGHAAPAWDYYAPELPAVRLPDIDVLDIEQTLGFDSARDFERLAAGARGVWLVNWQDEVVDPVGFAPYFLDRAGQEIPQPAGFWHVRVRHWRLDPDHPLAQLPQPQHSQGANFRHQIALLGWDGPESGEITLYWRALNPIVEDYQVSLVFETGNGQEVGRWDGRPAGYLYPTMRWQPPGSARFPHGEELFGRHPVPQGALYVSVAVYGEESAELDIMDVADNPAGKRVRLGPLD